MLLMERTHGEGRKGKKKDPLAVLNPLRTGLTASDSGGHSKRMRSHERRVDTAFRRDSKGVRKPALEKSGVTSVLVKKGYRDRLIGNEKSNRRNQQRLYSMNQKKRPCFSAFAGTVHQKGGSCRKRRETRRMAQGSKLGEGSPGGHTGAGEGGKNTRKEFEKGGYDRRVA